MLHLYLIQLKIHKVISEIRQTVRENTQLRLWCLEALRSLNNRWLLLQNSFLVATEQNSLVLTFSRQPHRPVVSSAFILSRVRSRQLSSKCATIHNTKPCYHFLFHSFYPNSIFYSSKVGLSFIWHSYNSQLQSFLLVFFIGYQSCSVIVKQFRTFSFCIFFKFLLQKFVTFLLCPIHVQHVSQFWQLLCSPSYL